MNAGSKKGFIDLFGGAGGWSIGLEMAGFRHLGLLDIDPVACRTAESHLSGEIFCCSIMDAPSDFLSLRPSVLVGSPPCQGFSLQGKKREEDPRNTLVWSFFDMVEHFNPDIWIFENVPGFASQYGGRFVKKVRDRLKSLPYNNLEALLNAADYGVPQFRKRFFMIGVREGFEARIPDVTHWSESDLFNGGTNQYVTLWDAISDLPNVGIGERIGKFEYNEVAQNNFQREMRRKAKEVTNHTTQKHSDRVLEKIRLVRPGESMSAFVNDFEENQVNYMGGYRRALKTAPSYTAYWTRGMTSIHPEIDRFLSPRECARIQSFPDRVDFKGATIENYRLVCNAVPPLVAFAWGKEMNRIFKLMD